MHKFSLLYIEILSVTVFCVTVTPLTMFSCFDYITNIYLQHVCILSMDVIMMVASSI